MQCIQVSIAKVADIDRVLTFDPIAVFGEVATAAAQELAKIGTLMVATSTNSVGKPA